MDTIYLQTHRQVLKLYLVELHQSYTHMLNESRNFKTTENHSEKLKLYKNVKSW